LHACTDRREMGSAKKATCEARELFFFQRVHHTGFNKGPNSPAGSPNTGSKRTLVTIVDDDQQEKLKSDLIFQFIK